MRRTVGLEAQRGGGAGQLVARQVRGVAARGGQARAQRPVHAQEQVPRHGAHEARLLQPTSTLSLTPYITKNLITMADGVSLDLAKAFDPVSNPISLNELEDIIIQEQAFTDH